MREEFNEAYKAALKAGDKRRTATLRAILAALKDRDIAARGEGKESPGEAEILAMLQKMVKQREESLAIYSQAGRADLAAVEKEELDIIGSFLPRGMSEEEVEEAIRAAIAATGASGVKDMGKVIAQLRADHPGRMDFGKVAGKVKAALS